MTTTHDQILVQLELQCAIRALRHARERCADEAAGLDLESLITGVLRVLSDAAPTTEQD